MMDAGSRRGGDCKCFANSKSCTTFVGGNSLTISMSFSLFRSDFFESDIVLHLCVVLIMIQMEKLRQMTQRRAKQQSAMMYMHRERCLTIGRSPCQFLLASSLQIP